MKKLNRMNIDALIKANPVLGIVEQRTILGGAGPGDCVFRCIAYLANVDQNAVRDKYAEYLMVTYCGCGPVVTSPTCGDCPNDFSYWQKYADNEGVDQRHLDWLMSQYNFHQIGSPQGDSILICQIQNGSQTEYHAVIATDVNQFILTYSDPQSGSSSGYLVNPNNCGTYTDTRMTVLWTYKR